MFAIRWAVSEQIGLSAFHDDTVRNVESRRVQVDETWSFVYAKQKNVATAKRLDLAYGDVWTWTAIDADSKLILSYLVGGRDSDYAIAFMDDLRSRLANQVQLTSDGHGAYLEAVEGAFGGNIDYSMPAKMYGAGPDSAKGRYRPAEYVGMRKRQIEGDPDPKHVSTSYVERQNLTMRMHMRRFTRLTPSKRRATNRRRSSITELSFHGINTPLPNAKKCYLCVRYNLSPISQVAQLK